jgi:hypothetical protein
LNATSSHRIASAISRPWYGRDKELKLFNHLLFDHSGRPVWRTILASKILQYIQELLN